jgi:hypothetical protein
LILDEIYNIYFLPLQTKFCNIFAMILSSIRLRKYDTEQMRTIYCECTIRNCKTNIHLILICSYILIFINNSHSDSHLNFSKCKRILYILFWMIVYENVAFNYIKNQKFLIRTLNSQVLNTKDCRDSIGFKRICACSVNC